MTHTSRLHEWNYFACRAADYADNQKQWVEFACLVGKYITTEAVKRYGDMPDDPVSKWTQQSCLDSVNKYEVRKGIPMRPEERGIDCIKRAHYACIAYFKEGGADKRTIINHALQACEDYYD